MPSGSMLPTLKIGQKFKVDKSGYDSERPRLDDIVVFHPPDGADSPNGICGNPRQGAGHPAACDTATRGVSNQTFVKRIVAGPGDRISIVGGHVIRNGVREKDAYITPCAGGEDCSFPQTITVPAGEYFVLGDNRGLSDEQPILGTGYPDVDHREAGRQLTPRAAPPHPS
jgi:signal peptidase I